MKIERHTIRPGGTPARCYVHARGLLLPSGFGLITTQKLELAGCDVFYGIEMMKTTDGGEHFSPPALCQSLARRYAADGSSAVMCDATPFYHQKTGKILLTGHAARYSADNRLLRTPCRRRPLYAVYNEEKGDFEAWYIYYSYNW